MSEERKKHGTTKREIDMLNGPLMGKIMLVALPLALSGILQLLFNAADLIVVGQFSSTPDESIAAVGSTTSLIHLIINLAVGLSVGSNVVMAQAIGAKDDERANRTLHTSLLIALICGIGMGIIGLLGANTFLRWMDSPLEVIDKATAYLQIYFLGLPANLVYNFGAAILRAKGDTARPMAYLTVAGFVNIGLNLWLVSMGWDVAGVAIATIISQYVSAILLLIALFREQGVCKLSLKNLRICKDEFWSIFRIGLPSGILGTCFSLSNVIIQSAINGYGKVLTSANSVASNIEGFLYTAMNAVSSAALTFAGQNYGAKKYDRIKKVMFCSTALVLAIWFVMGSLVLTFASQLAGLYNDNPEVITFAVERLWYIVVCYFLCSVNEVFVSGLRSMNHTVGPVIISLFCTCVFRIVWVFTACAQVGQPFMLYLSYPISWLGNLVLTSIYFIVVYRGVLRKAAQEDVQTAQEDVQAAEVATE